MRAAWERRVVSKMNAKLTALRAAGLPAALYGRVILQKVLYLGVAVFYATNQVPQGMKDLIAQWSDECWRLLWQTHTGEERDAAAPAHGSRAPFSLSLIHISEPTRPY